MEGYCKTKLACVAVMSFLASNIFAEPTDPCAGFLNLVNRPSISDSACPVQMNKAVLETGINYLNLGSKHGYLLPQAEFRLGLPDDNEIYSNISSYIIQNYRPYKGATPTDLGLKHKFFYNDKWIFSMEIAVVLPTGSNFYGSNGTGATLNALLQYSFTPTLSLLGMLSLNSLTMPTSLGGQRYTTLNPSAVLTEDVTDNFEIYLEVFGQTRTAANQGSGFDTDFGVLYLLRKNWEVDAEVGHRLSGIPIGYNSYAGIGTSFLFG